MSWRGEADQFWNSAEEAAHTHCCGNLPLLIISQDPNSPQSGQPPPIQPIWNSLQERLKTLSTRSRRVIARSSGHAVMIDRPDVVIHGIDQISASDVGEVGTTSLR